MSRSHPFQVESLEGRVLLSSGVTLHPDGARRRHRAPADPNFAAVAGLTIQPPSGVGIGSVIATATGDFNGDGKPDLAVIFSTNSGTPTKAGLIAILLGTGKGTYQTAKFTKLPELPSPNIALGDFNGDGHLDLATITANATTSATTLRIYNGDGKGNLSAGSTFATNVGAVGLVSGNFVKTRRPSTTLAYMDSTGSSSSYQGLLEVTHFDKKGRISGVSSTDIPYNYNTFSVNAAAADLNGDGVSDVVMQAPGTLYTAINNGQGVFTISSSLDDSGAGLAVGDINGDGKPDIITGSGHQGDYIDEILNNGNGTFGLPDIVDTSAQQIVSVELGDFNGDGKLDVVGINASGAALVASGDGSGAFNAPVSFSTGLSQNALDYTPSVADLNKDGKSDLIVGSTNDAIGTLIAK